MRRQAMVVVAALSVLVTTLTFGVAGAEEGTDIGASAVIPAAEAQALGATYTVRFVNTTEGQYLTPPNFVAHTSSVDVFQRGHAASPELQALAENGAVPGMAAALTAAVDDAGLGASGVGADGPVGPGGEVTFEFTTIANKVSVVAMLICTNDGFAGLDSRNLPRRDGQTLRYRLGSYDAGTELNTEDHDDLVPAPFCGGDGAGTGETNEALAEDGVVKRHRGVTGVGDLDDSFDFGRTVAEMWVTRTDPAATYTVSIENLTEGQYLTPPNYAAHGSDHSIFASGAPASAELQALAENGAVPGMAAALTAAIDDAGTGVSGVAAEAPIGPGATAEFELTTTARRFSLVSMLICTNDGFGAVNGRRLPVRDGQTITYRVRAYDAGTEVNTEDHDDLVPAPFCGGDGAGTGETDPALAENGVITGHRGIAGVGDLDESFDFRRTVAVVRITRHDPAPVYTLTIDNATSGQYLTPANIAVHDRSVDVFQRGHAAGSELQDLAENGNVPGMAALLAAAVDSAGLGASGVAGSGPIAPGSSATIHVQTRANRISLVSMLICTNDGFAGIDNRPLIMGKGHSLTYSARAYDAGTEINTEDHDDLVPAPFCGGEGAGSGASNPALAEGGVVDRHRGIEGVGDLDDSFDWRGRVAQLTATRG